MKPRDMTKQECDELISKSRVGRIGLSSNSKPYVIPISYVYSGGVIYLHSGVRGKKLEMAKENPQICFEVDSLENSQWKSVVISGNVRVSDSLDSKQKVFDMFIKSKMGGHGGKAFKREDLDKMPMCIWEIEIEEMTGRQGVW